MPNQIPFPKNYERFIELGQEALQANQLVKALDYFKEAYSIRQEFPLNFLIASTCLDLGEVEEALTIASEMREDYLSCLEYLELFVQILIGNNKFITAHCLINKRILQENSGEMQKLIALKKQIRHVELMYQQFEVEKINDLKQQLACVGDCGHTEQMQLIKKAIHLPQEEFVSMAKNVLVEPKVHNLVRSWVLEELAHLHIKEKITFLWHDGTLHTLIPAQAQGPLDNGIYQRIQFFLEKELLNEDPILLINIIEEVRLHFALLYPLAEKIIDEPQLWAFAYLTAYDQEKSERYSAHNDKIQTIHKVQAQIRCQLEQLTF